MAHGEGEGRPSVSTCSQHATRHTRPGQSMEEDYWAVCAHIAPMTCEPAGRNNVRGLRALALSTLRLTTLEKTQGGASQRPSALAGPMFCVVVEGRLK